MGPTALLPPLARFPAEYRDDLRTRREPSRTRGGLRRKLSEHVVCPSQVVNETPRAAGAPRPQQLCLCLHRHRHLDHADPETDPASSVLPAPPERRAAAARGCSRWSPENPAPRQRPRSFGRRLRRRAPDQTQFPQSPCTASFAHCPHSLCSLCHYRTLLCNALPRNALRIGIHYDNLSF